MDDSTFRLFLSRVGLEKKVWRISRLFLLIIAVNICIVVIKQNNYFIRFTLLITE